MERLTYRGANTPYFNKDGDEIKAYSDTKLREIINKLADYEDMKEQGRLIELPCKMGSTVYVLAECKNIQPQLDGTLYSPDGSPGTATGYYCPYEDDCPHIDFSDDCDKCKYFHILYEPIRTSGVLWDLGRAKCEKHNLITDFANYGKFKRLDTCENYEPQESEEEGSDTE